MTRCSYTMACGHIVRTCDHIAFTVYKYLQINQPFVGDNLGFWDERSI